MLARVDLYILAQFYRLLCLMGRWWGMTASKATQHSACVMLALMFMQAALDFPPPVVDFIMIGSTGLLVFMLYEISQRADEQPNLNLIRQYPNRMVGLFFVVFNAVNAIFRRHPDVLPDLGWLAYVAALYFASCPAPPPKRQPKLASEAWRTV